MIDEADILQFCNRLFANSKAGDDRSALMSSALEKFGVNGEVYLEQLSSVLDGYAVSNESDFNYSNCFSFVILLNKGSLFPHMSRDGWIHFLENLQVPTYQLTVNISVILNCFECHFRSDNILQETGKIKTVSQSEPFLPEHQQVLNKVRDYLTSKNLFELREELLAISLPNIELELAERGEVAVYNCLFHDSYGGYTSARTFSMEW